MEGRNRSEGEAGRPPGTDLLKIRQYMEDHYDENLSVDLLARMASLSPKYFVDLFKKTYGQSAIDYLTALRMNRAKRYLIETDYRLREIAERVGYSDEFYFSRKFKKEVGVSPSQFVKQPRKRIAACAPSVIGQLLALNIMPVAAPLDSKWTPYYYHVYHKRIMVHMNYRDEPGHASMANLFRARPDAIIGTEYLPDEEKQMLDRIAPTLFVAARQAGWREQLRQIACFVGREEQAGAWIEEYRKKVEWVRQQILQAVRGETFAVVRVYGNHLHVYCNQVIQDVLYGDLKLSPAYTEDNFHNQKLSLAQLHNINPDRILMMVCPEAESRTYWLSLQHDTGWRKLKAIRQGHLYMVAPDPWCEYSAVAVNRVLDEIVLLLTGYCPNPLMDKVHGGAYAHDI